LNSATNLNCLKDSNQLNLLKLNFLKLKFTYNVELGHLQIPDKQVRPESGRHSSKTGDVPFENEQVELIVFFDKHEFDETFLYWL
jgi:hypothetical protein